MVDNILIGYKMHNVLLYALFRWFIQIATLGDA
jgi:hypothetical protein